MSMTATSCVKICANQCFTQCSLLASTYHYFLGAQDSVIHRRAVHKRKFGVTDTY